MHQNMHRRISPSRDSQHVSNKVVYFVGAGRGGRTPTTLRSADFESVFDGFAASRT